VDSLVDLGINARGIDIDDRVKDRPNLQYQSLFDLTDERAELVICMEVAEHIDAAQADRVVEKVAAAVEHTLIWTAAVPGQGGVGHINLQEPEYWAEKFQAQGLRRDLAKEQQLKDYARQGYHMGWFTNNLLYFEKV
jgi:hypothetical protein